MESLLEILLIFALLTLPIVVLLVIFVRSALIRRRCVRSMRELGLDVRPDLLYKKGLSEEEKRRVDAKSLSPSYYAAEFSAGLAGAMLFYGIAKILGAELGFLGLGVLCGLGGALGTSINMADEYFRKKRATRE